MFSSLWFSHSALKYVFFVEVHIKVCANSYYVPGVSIFLSSLIYARTATETQPCFLDLVSFIYILSGETAELMLAFIRIFQLPWSSVN